MNFVLSLILELFLMLGYFFSHYLMKKTFGNMSPLQFLTHQYLFYVDIFIYSVASIPMMLFGFRSVGQLRAGITDDNVYFAYCAVLYSIIMVPLFIWLFSGGKIKRKLSWYLLQDVNTGKSEHDQIFFSCATVFSCACVVYLCIYNAPLWKLLTGRIQSVITERIAYSRNFQGSTFVRNIFCQTYVVLISYITFIYWITEKTHFWKSTFIINFLCALFVYGASLSRSGMISYLIPLIFLWQYSGKRIRFTKYVQIILLLICIIAVMFEIASKSSTSAIKILLDIQNGPIFRLFFIQMQSLPVYHMVFPRHTGFGYFKSITLFNYLGLSDFFEPGRIVQSYIEPDAVRLGKAGVANTLFMSDAYASFGWAGFFLSPIVVAFCFVFSYNKLLDSEKNPVNIAAHTCIIYQYCIAYTGGFSSTYLFSIKIISIYIFLLFYHACDYTFTRRVQSRRR